MAERAGPSRQAAVDAAEVDHLSLEFAQLVDEVIEKALGELFTAMAERGLGFAELRTLRALAESPLLTSRGRAASSGDLAEATGMSSRSLRGAVETLESRGFVASTAKGAVSLTSGGGDLLSELWSRRLAALTEFVRERDLGERLRLAGALQLLDVHGDSSGSRWGASARVRGT